ncbi:hypothetical protein [Pseudarthrobacter siccitolerans]
MHDPLIEAIHDHEPLSDPLEEINLRLAIAATDIAELRAEVARLDRALEESRRLNLKAAELLNLVYSHGDDSRDDGEGGKLPGALDRPASDGIPE